MSSRPSSPHSKSQPSQRRPRRATSGEIDLAPAPPHPFSQTRVRRPTCTLCLSCPLCAADPTATCALCEACSRCHGAP